MTDRLDRVRAAAMDAQAATEESELPGGGLSHVERARLGERIRSKTQEQYRFLHDADPEVPWFKTRPAARLAMRRSA